MNILAGLINWWAIGTETNGFITDVFSGDSYVFLDANTNDTCLIRLDKVMAPVKGQKNFQSSKEFAKKLLCPKSGSRPLIRIVLNRIEDDIHYVDLYYPLATNDDVKHGEKYLQATMITNGLAFLYNEDSDEKLYGLQKIAKHHSIGCWSQERIVYPWNFQKTKHMMKKSASKKK